MAKTKIKKEEVLTPEPLIVNQDNIKEIIDDVKEKLIANDTVIKTQDEMIAELGEVAVQDIIDNAEDIEITEEEIVEVLQLPERTLTKAPEEIKADEVLGKDGYRVKMTFNDTIHEFEATDLAVSIMKVKPIFLKTKVTFYITRLSDGKMCGRQLFVRGGKMIFRNALSLKIFINTLIFK